MSSAEGPLGVVTMAATTLYVSDIDKAIDWYRDKLGLEPAMAGTDDLRYAGVSPRRRLRRPRADPGRLGVGRARRGEHHGQHHRPGRPSSRARRAGGARGRVRTAGGVTGVRVVPHARPRREPLLCNETAQLAGTVVGATSPSRNRPADRAGAARDPKSHLRAAPQRLLPAVTAASDRSAQ